MTKKKYAMKVFVNDSKKSRLFQHRIQNEIYILNLLQQNEISSSDFTCKLHSHARNDLAQFLLLELIPGDTLRKVIFPIDEIRYDKQMRRIRDGFSAGISQKAAKFFIAAISLPLLHFRQHSIVYRDLKPENIVIDRVGYPKLIDFGLAKHMAQPGYECLDGKTYTLCGTPEYLAPEVILGDGYSYPADWWSLGVLFFEMVVGVSPFLEFGVPRANQNDLLLYQNIVKNKVFFPGDVEIQCKSLIQSLLTTKPTQRLNCNRKSIFEFQSHPCFEGLVDWQSLKLKQMSPPWYPELNRHP